MIKIIAYIKLYKEGRRVPFHSGYRPLFSFMENVYSSGSIKLINSEKLNPGEEGIVEILFLDKKYLGEDFGVDSCFTFGEGREPLGEGIVKEINDNFKD
jgi:elongation factor Tu